MFPKSGKAYQIFHIKYLIKSVLLDTYCAIMNIVLKALRRPSGKTLAVIKVEPQVKLGHDSFPVWEYTKA